jgi:hypothetical protein
VDFGGFHLDAVVVVVKTFMILLVQVSNAYTLHFSD